MEYDDIRKYCNDLACVELNGKRGYINRDRKSVV